MEQIKRHPFFYGVDWDIIRHVDAPFVPHLRSITDTSYFPTEELDQVPDDAGAKADIANKDVAFLGFVHCRLRFLSESSYLTYQTATHSSASQSPKDSLLDFIFWIYWT